MTRLRSEIGSGLSCGAERVEPKRKMRRIAERDRVKKVLKCAVALGVFLASRGYRAQSAPPWVIGPFTRPATGNPVIAPNPASTFLDPILKAPVHWEALHTFNPAAIVRDGKVLRALSRGRQLGRDGDRRAYLAAGPGRKRRRHPLQAHRRAGVLSRRRRPEGARVARRRRRSAHRGTRRRHVCADLHAMEPQDLLGGHCHFARPDALDQIRAGISDRAGRQVCAPEIQVGGNRHAAEGRAADCGEDRRTLLDVLGRRRDPPGHFGRPDSLDAGRGYAREAGGAAAAAPGAF